MDSVAPARWLDHRPGQWIGEQTWPPQHDTAIQFYFAGSNSTASLSDQSHECTLQVNSAQHCGANSGEYFPFTFGPELPDEQSEDDALSVCLDTPVLQNTLDIVGAPVVELNLSADQTSGLIAVRLCDLRADGTSALISMGVLNLAHRHSFADPTELVPNESFTTQVILDQIAYRLPAGHKLRIALSTSYWPFIWPSAQPTTLTVNAGELTLPVRHERESSDVEFEKPVTAPQWKAEERRAPAATRDVYKDDESDEYITSIINDFGEYKDKHHGLINGSVVSERWSIRADDPLAATGEIHWQQTGGRDDWEWNTDVILQVSADASHLFVSATLNAYNNGEQILSKEYKDKIARVFI